MNIFIFKQKTANEMRNSDWRSDVCSSDLTQHDLDAHMAVSGRHRLVQQGVDVGAPLDDAADQGREELRIGVEVEALFGLTEAVALKLPQDEFGLLAVQVDLIERLDRREPRQPAPGRSGRVAAASAAGRRPSRRPGPRLPPAPNRRLSSIVPGSSEGRRVGTE